jgi:hypothetical protein
MRPSSAWAPTPPACCPCTAGANRCPACWPPPWWPACSAIVTGFLVVRGQDLARLMVTLGIGLMLFEAANKAAFITGGVDGLSGMMVGQLFGASSST